MSPACNEPRSKIPDRSLLGHAFEDGYEPEAAGLKSRPLLLQQADRPAQTKSHAAAQPRKRPFVVKAASFRDRRPSCGHFGSTQMQHDPLCRGTRFIFSIWIEAMLRASENVAFLEPGRSLTRLPEMRNGPARTWCVPVLAAELRNPFDTPPLPRDPESPNLIGPAGCSATDTILLWPTLRKQ